MIIIGASYTLAWILEWLRWQLRSAIPVLISTVLIGVGLMFHTSHTWLRVQQAVEASGSPLASWYHWFLVSAWSLAVACLVFKLLRPTTSLGLFLLPLVILLMAATAMATAGALRTSGTAFRGLQFVHSGCLLLGTVGLHLGCAMALMYLVKSYWLKRKVTDDRGLRLPSLEWLQRWAGRSLWASLPLLVAGLVLGMGMNLAPRAQAPPLPWTDPIIGSSAAFLAWTLVVATFLVVYPPARTGRKVAYLTLASYLALLFVLGFPLVTPHESHSQPSPPKTASEASRHPGAWRP